MSTSVRPLPVDRPIERPADLTAAAAPTAVLSPAAVGLARQIERLAETQQAADALRALDTRAQVLGIRAEQAAAETAITEQRRGEFRSALQTVYRDPAAAERAFTEVVRQQGPMQAAATLRTAPERLGALITVDTKHLRGLVTRHDDTVARAAAPRVADAATVALSAEQRAERIVNTVYERTLAERAAATRDPADATRLHVAQQYNAARAQARDMAPMPAFAMSERLAEIQSAQRGAGVDVLAKRTALAESGKFLGGDPAKEVAALSKSIGEGLAKLPPAEVAMMRNLLSTAGERALGTVTSLGLTQVRQVALGAER